MRSSGEIAISLADYLETFYRKQYPPNSRADTVCEVNDILQGRAQRTVQDFFRELETSNGGDLGEVAQLKRDAEDFQRQRSLIKEPNPYVNSEWPYEPEIMGGGSDLMRKVIDQKLYDAAAERGFPSSFFRQSFFDHVTLYDIPDFQDCSLSVFQSCKFSVCRLHGIDFEDTNIYSSDFNTVYMESTFFDLSSMASTRFRDCEMREVSFRDCHMKSVRALDCVMERVSFSGARLDGCSFDRVKPHIVTGLRHATITQSGATDEECERNRRAIWEALAPARVPKARTPPKARGGR